MAEQIVQWLISIEAVKPIKTDCILSLDKGYPIDVGAYALSSFPKYLPFNLITNGLQVTTERTVFDTGENGLDSFVCPSCKEDIITEQFDFTDFFETGNSLLTCPLCSKQSELNQYNIEPAWAFGNLGFTFWNWSDFKDEFLEEFEKRLGCNIKVVEQRI